MYFVIVSVGNEILSGDIANTNATYIARRLTEKGHKVIKMVVVPDDVNAIAEEVKNHLKHLKFQLNLNLLQSQHKNLLLTLIL